MSRGNVTPIRYFFDCCTVPADRVVKKAGQKIRCPDHPKTSTYLSVDCACQVCGATTNGRTVKMYCEPCRQQVQALRNRNFRKNKETKKKINPQFQKSISRKPYQNGRLRDQERSDCKNRIECLKIYDLYDAVPCKGCERYVQQMGNFDPLYIKE